MFSQVSAIELPTVSLPILIALHIIYSSDYLPALIPLPLVCVVVLWDAVAVSLLRPPVLLLLVVALLLLAKLLLLVVVLVLLLLVEALVLLLVLVTPLPPGWFLEDLSRRRGLEVLPASWLDDLGFLWSLLMNLQGL